MNKTKTKLIPVPMDEQLIEYITLGMKQAGESNRAEFIRQAVREKLGIAEEPMAAPVAESDGIS